MKDEMILCIKRELIKTNLLFERGGKKMSSREFNEYFGTLSFEFKNRIEIENDSNYKQLIPYIIIENAENKILTYKRKGNERRLNSLYSIGIGGHITDKDAPKENNTLWEIILSGTKRELNEEITGINDGVLNFSGILNEEQTEVGKVHFGLLFSVKTENEIIPNEELFRSEWKNTNEIKKSINNYELWSQIAFKIRENL